MKKYGNMIMRCLNSLIYTTNCGVYGRYEHPVDIVTIMVTI